MEQPDLRALMLPLSPAAVGLGGYTRMDRYADFRAVFFTGNATDTQRERVLFQILAECGVNSYLYGQDAHDTYRMLGKREIGLTLMEWLTTEPGPEPAAVAERYDPRSG